MNTKSAIIKNIQVAKSNFRKRTLKDIWIGLSVKQGRRAKENDKQLLVRREEVFVTYREIWKRIGKIVASNGHH